MGGEQSIPCNKLCNESWENYANEDCKLRDGWEVILDDTREVETISTMSDFLANFADIFENLFLGSEDSMSNDVHATLVDVMVKRLQSIIQMDWVNHKNGKFTPSPIRFMRINDDRRKNRKFQLIFVMVLRIISVKKQDTEKTDLETHEASVEMSVRIQLRNTEEIFMYQPEEEEGYRC